MRKQKLRNALVASEDRFIDLGVLNMIPTQMTETTDDDSQLEPEDDEIEILEPRNWTVRNKVIVRNS